MKLTELKKNFAPHLIALLIFIGIASIYLGPAIGGKVLHQNDGMQATGMAKEVADFKAETGEVSMWTNSAFGGMPAYQIKGDASYNVFWYINHLIRFGLPYSTIAIMFVYMLGFYVLLSVLKFRVWLSITGAIAFALASYNIVIIEAGHITKAYAIGLMAPVIAGIIITYRKKFIAGGILSTVALGLQIAVNHVQITYYLMFMVILLGIYFLIEAIKEKTLAEFGKATGILAVAALLAVGPNITNLWTTYEYGKESIRGESELSPPKGEEAHSGLNKIYAHSWSYGKVETLTFLIPNAVGGYSNYLGNNKKAMEDVPQQFAQYVAQSSQYWGNQPGTSGPVYAGVILIFLFVLGMFIVNDNLKWWLLAATLLSIVLSWGHNFPPLTDFFFYHVPLYNKFRTVSMALVIAGVTIPLMAMLTLKEIIAKASIIVKRKVEFLVSIGLVAGLVLMLALVPKILTYTSDYELMSQKEQIQNIYKEKVNEQEKLMMVQQYNEFYDTIENARISIFRADAYRSLLFILLAAALIFAFGYGKIKNKEIFISLIALLVVIDLWSVDVRYLSYDKFEHKNSVKNSFVSTEIDNMILKDTDPDYRVLNLSVNTFNDAYTSYFHKSIGGYHGAKLRRYQDVIDSVLAPTTSMLRRTAPDTTGQFENILKSSAVLNMLNTKYLIINQKEYMINMDALGHVWFVTDYRMVDNADQELKELYMFNPQKSAIIDKRFTEGEDAVELPKVDFFETDTGSIYLSDYKPNNLKYQARNSKDQLAVFSEIYYDKGWNAYIDDKPVKQIRVNYLLRAVVVPAGKHEIEFRFEPNSFEIGQKVSLASSIIIILMLIGGLLKYLKGYNSEVQQPIKKHKR